MNRWIIIGILFRSALLHAQQVNEFQFSFPNQVWMKYLGDDDVEYNAGIYPYINNQILVVQTTQPGNLARTTYKKFYILSQSGVVIKEFEFHADFTLTKVFVNDDGSILLFGNVECIGWEYYTEDILMAEIDPDGFVLWAKCYGTFSHENIRDVVRENNDYYYLIGYSEGDYPSPHDTIQENKGESDIWIQKVTRYGDVIWSKKFGGSKDETAVAGTVDDNSLYLYGGTSSKDGDFAGNTLIYNYFFMKMDLNGKLEHVAFVNDTTSSLSLRFIPTYSTDSLKLYGAVRPYSSPNPWTTNSINYDGIICTISKQSLKMGSFQTIGGTDDDEIRYMEQLPDSSFLITMYTNSKDGDLLGLNPYSDLHMWMFHLKNGVLSNHQFYYNITESGVYGYYNKDDDSWIGEMTSDGIDTSFYDKYGRGYSSVAPDVRVFKLGNISTTGLQKYNPTVNDFEVFPNPTTGRLFFRSAQPPLDIQVFNYQGQQVLSAEGNTTSISLEKFPQGIYLVRLRTNQGVQCAKVTLHN